MAQRRMFSPDIVSSDDFLDMPVSSQVLYFHLAMRADDDGFVTPKMVMRIIGSSEDDLKVLKAKRFILPFESGVIVIKHWLIHNLIRADLYKETLYKKEKSTLGLNEIGAYTELREGASELKQIEPPEWLKRRRGGLRTADVPQTAPRLGKVRLGKDIYIGTEQELGPNKKATSPTSTLIGDDKESVDVSRETSVLKPPTYTDTMVQKIMDYWNSMPTSQSVGVKRAPNPSAEQTLLPITSKITKDLKQAIGKRLRSYPNVEDWNGAIKKYAIEIINRTPGDNSYYKHRMSLYDFANQKNGFIRFVSS